MQAVFGVGLHPLAAQRQQQLQGPDKSVRNAPGSTTVTEMPSGFSSPCSAPDLALSVAFIIATAPKNWVSNSLESRVQDACERASRLRGCARGTPQQTGFRRA